MSRTGVPGWETGTTRVSQPGQIMCSAVVIFSTAILLSLWPMHKVANPSLKQDYNETEENCLFRYVPVQQCFSITFAHLQNAC